MHTVYQIWEKWLVDAYAMDAEVQECDCGINCDEIRPCYTNTALKDGKVIGVFKTPSNYGWLDKS